MNASDTETHAKTAARMAGLRYIILTCGLAKKKYKIMKHSFTVVEDRMFPIVLVACFAADDAG